MFLHHLVCSVHFPTVQKHIGIKTIPHFYWKNDKGVEPANGIQPAFSGDFVSIVEIWVKFRTAFQLTLEALLDKITTVKYRGIFRGSW